jgi:hypothetical protein
MKEYSIDLRWSLWAAYPEEFDSPRAQEALAAMRAAFEGGVFADEEEVTIHTAPKKEIRFGRVEVFEGGAKVEFSFEWDEPYEQLWRVEEVAGELTESEAQAAKNEIASWMGEMTWSIEEEIYAITFDELLQKIDKVETELLALEDSQSKAFDPFLKALGEQIKEERKDA